MAEDAVFWFANTQPLFAPLGCVDARRRGRWIFVSAQAGLDEQLRPAATLPEQARRTLAQLRTALDEVGGAQARVCSLAVYVNTTAFDGPVQAGAAQVAAAWKEQFGAAGPAAMTTGVQMFGIPQLYMEISCIALA
jgi:enamine deaminase RidA (YjgF/YER057c/UK114 family)